MTRNRVYSILFAGNLLAGAAGGNGFRINNFNRTAKVKSITFDIRFEDVTNAQQIPTEQNNVARYRLDAVSVPGEGGFTQVFEDYFEVNIHAVGNGNAFTLTRPSTIKLDSFYIRNQLRFAFTISNQDILNEIAYVGTVVVEIEDIEST